MLNRTVLLLCIIVIEYIAGIRTESDCLKNDLNKKICSLIDVDVNPCDDFYQFACGKYIAEKRKISSRYSLITHDETLKSKRILIDSLNYHMQNRNASDWNWNFDHNLVIDLYTSCMNRSRQAVDPLIRVLNKYGGWPALKGENWAGLEKTKGILREGFDMEPILKMRYVPPYVSKYLVNSAEEFSLKLPTFAVHKSEILDTNTMYFNLMIQVAMKFGADIATAVIDMSKVLIFEIALIKISVRSEISYKISITEMESRYPALMKYIRPFVEPYAANNSDIKIKLDPLQYFESLESILINTTDETIASYLLFRAVLDGAKYSSKRFNGEVASFMNSVNHRRGYNPQAAVSDDEECFDHVYDLIPIAVDSVFLKDILLLIAMKRAAANKIVVQIWEELIKMVKEAEWIDEITRSNVTEKLNMRIILAEFRLRLRELYRVKLNIDNFFDNALTIKRNERDHPSGKPYISSWIVSSIYKRYQNQIHVPIGALQWPLFYLPPYFSLKTNGDLHASSYFDFGTFGYLIGHEMAHTIDETNHQLNAQGRPFSWPKATEEQYVARANCFKGQYSAMQTETGIKLNGAKTVKEDMADNIGVRAAYRAYRRLTADNYLLPGLLNYSPRQLFWISMAQSRCAFVHPSNYASMIDHSSHTLHPYRVLGMIMNMPEFSEDFSCPSNTRMYGENFVNNRCKLI